MSDLSEDESSDSSREFLVDPDKINLNSSFFSDETSNRQTSKRTVQRIDTDEDSTDDDDFHDVSQNGSVELFSQVLKNLESTRLPNVTNEKAENEQSATELVSESNAKARKSKVTQVDAQKATSSNEISQLLLQGESGAGNFSCKPDNDEDEDDEEQATTSAEYTIPQEGVRITLPDSMTGLVLRRKKRGGPDVKAILRKQLRANQILIEKVGLLCWLGYGFHLNRQINITEVMSTSLSLLSTYNYPKTLIDLKYIEKFTNWFKGLFAIEAGDSKIDKETLLQRLKEKKILDYKELVLLYIATLRAMGLNCRLVISLNPPHRILNDDPIFKVDTKNQNTKQEEKPEKSTAKSKKTKGKAASKKSSKESSGEKVIPKNSPEAEKNAKLEAKKRAAELLQAKTQKTARAKGGEKNTKKETVKEEPATKEKEAGVSNLRQLRSRKVLNTSSETEIKQSAKAVTKSDGTKSKYYMDEDTDSEEEFQPKQKRPSKRKLDEVKTEPDAKLVPETKENKKNRKVLSSDSEEEDTSGTRKTQDVWAEVYLESEESWICVSVMDCKVHCVAEVYKKAKKPVLYVVAWNNEGLIKDVTRRYCAHWLTVTRKQRIDEKWWGETVSIWKEKNTVISREEDEMLLQKELEQPLPKTVSECKGHPLYVLVRHLLKYEALYPPDCVPLGHLKTGEAIYSRHCVHTLCSREKWLKLARVVKPNQEPYKVVKAMPRYDKLSGMKIKDMPLELYGQWQTMDYVPPEAKDGIVPRNEYGNVDLFKQCMLPKGTVHINLPGLNRVARKLNIDCAPAVVGFNFGNIGAVPAFEGFVVCTEYEDTLREAWEAEQVEAAKRARERYEKRVYGNWKRLIQGLIIRERLAAKYEFSQSPKPALASKRTKHKNVDTKKSKIS